MRNQLIKLFIPHEVNNYYPLATKPISIIGYCIVFLLANFLVFPKINVESTRVLAANIDTTQIIELTNNERVIAGLQKLTNNDDLTRAALAKGKDMLKKQYWSHYGPNGETPWQFIAASGYNYIYAGENLAKDFQNSVDANEAWMNSTTHKANILNQNYHDIGVAYVTGELNGQSTTIIVQMFGSREIPDQTPVAATPKPTIALNPNEGIETYKPKILKPENNALLHDSSIKLSGEATKGDSIQVFSNGKLLGELPKDAPNFTINVSLIEEINKLQIQSIDQKTRYSSLLSDEVNVTLDTTPPDLNNIDIEYYTQDQKTYLVLTSVESLKSASLTYSGKTENLIAKDQYFYITFPKSVQSGTLDVFDKAGNVSVKELNFKDQQTPLDQLPAAIGKTTTGGSSSKFLGLTIPKFGAKEAFNLFMVSIFMCILSLDAIFLIKYGKARDFASKHGFHLALLVLVVISVLTVFKI